MSRGDRLLWGYVVAFLVVALAWAALASGALAQEADKGLTVTVTLTADQVKALKAYRELRNYRRPDGLVYATSDVAVPIPPSTPDYDVVPKVKPVLGFQAWVEERMAAHLNSMIEEVERQAGEELASEVRALTPEQKRAIKAQVEALKVKK